MATNKLYKFQRIGDVMTFLNGGILGGKVNQRSGFASNVGAGIVGLVGTTLTFSEPAAATVTFGLSNTGDGSAVPPGTNPDPYTLLFSDIKAQIQAVMTGCLVLLDADGRIVIIEATPTDGVTVLAGSAGGFATVVSPINLNGLTYGSGGSLDTLVLNLKHTGGTTLTVTFAAPANRGAVVTQINAVTVAGGITASINGNNELVFTTSDQGSAVSISVLAGSANTPLGLTVAVTTGAAVNTANGLLGFDSANNTVGKVYKPVAVSTTPPCWTWADTDNGGAHIVYTWE